MLMSEMEAVLRSLDQRVEKLDQRVGRIELILPTLATKAELRDQIRGVKVLIEDVRGDVRSMADQVSSLMQDSADTKQQFAFIRRRLDQMGGVLERLDRRGRRREPE
jgi:hypothetical protein